MNILIIEDEVLLASSIKDLLESRGFRAEAVYDAEDAHRVEGLEAGADYYLTKPFDSRELIACVNALLRRQGGQVDELRRGNTALDLLAGTLTCGERQVRLSAREFGVMRQLMQAGDRHVSEVFVGFLRKKLRSIGSDVRIEAVRGLGYHVEVGER